MFIDAAGFWICQMFMLVQSRCALFGHTSACHSRAMYCRNVVTELCQWLFEKARLCIYSDANVQGRPSQKVQDVQHRELRKTRRGQANPKDVQIFDSAEVRTLLERVKMIGGPLGGVEQLLLGGLDPHIPEAVVDGVCGRLHADPGLAEASIWALPVETQHAF